jgi:hypothetical protein
MLCMPDCAAASSSMLLCACSAAAQDGLLLAMARVTRHMKSHFTDICLTRPSRGAQRSIVAPLSAQAGPEGLADVDKQHE